MQLSMDNVEVCFTWSPRNYSSIDLYQTVYYLDSIFLFWLHYFLMCSLLSQNFSTTTVKWTQCPRFSLVLYSIMFSFYSSFAFSLFSSFLPFSYPVSCLPLSSSLISSFLFLSLSPSHSLPHPPFFSLIVLLCPFIPLFCSLSFFDFCGKSSVKVGREVGKGSWLQT